jgi:hypothetical protein
MWGVALDLAAGRAYWGRSGGISFARLDGSGGGDLDTAGATPGSANGVAIDPLSGRIYWVEPGTISFAALDGSGGGDIGAPGAFPGAPYLPALLKSPAAAGAPLITGSSAAGAVLSCSNGTWAPDLLASHLYRVPASFAYQWSLDGATIAGATASLHTASAPGEYRCTVAASNAAGTSSQTSAAHAVLPAFGADTLVTLALAAKKIPAKGPLKIRVRNRNDFDISGRLAGRTAKKVDVARRRRVRLKAKAFRVGASSRRTVRLRLPRPLRGLLRRKGRLSLRVVAAVTDPAGQKRSVKKKVAPKLRRASR